MRQNFLTDILNGQHKYQEGQYLEYRKCDYLVRVL